MNLSNKVKVGASAFVVLALWLTLGTSNSSTLPDLKPYAAPAETAPVTSENKPTASATKKIQTLDVSAGNVVTLSGVVGMETFNVVPEINRYSNSGKPTYLIINSPGGSVMDGAKILAAMQASKAPVYTICVELCASMAYIIEEYGAKRYATDRSVLMAHPASISSSISGELDKVVSRFTFMKRYIDKMDVYIATRAGITYEAFKAKTTQEYWLDAEDALAQNFLDSIVSVPNLSKYTESMSPNSLAESLDLDATAK